MEIRLNNFNDLVVNDARFVEGWRTNFSGMPTPVNPDGGIRGFSITLDDVAFAKKLAEEGWNVKPREDEDGNVVAYTLPVAVRYDPRFPIDIRVSKGGGKAVKITEETVSTLDSARFYKMNMLIRGSRWSKLGKSGVKAYLSVLHAWAEEDPLADDFDEDEDLPF